MPLLALNKLLRLPTFNLDYTSSQAHLLADYELNVVSMSPKALKESKESGTGFKSIEVIILNLEY